VMADVWLHNGFLQVEGEKMSKSLGNFITIRDVLKDWPGEVVRLNMLKTHYRQPIDWTLRGLIDSQKIWSKWINLDHVQTVRNPDSSCIAALCDDLNTSEFIRLLDSIAEKAKKGDEQSLEKFSSTAQYFGFISEGPGNFFFPGIGFDANPSDELIKLLRAVPSNWTVKNLRIFLNNYDLIKSNGFPDVLGLISEASPEMSLWDLKSKIIYLEIISSQIESRASARKIKDWAASDLARYTLEKIGIAVKDNENGTTTWSVKR
jgi:cysteinyl-tRNA synthetase